MKIRSVKYNFIMNVILNVSTIIFPLITFPYISRILLPAGVGKVNFATSVVSYFSMIAMLGIPTYGIRACAKVRDDREELSRTVHEILIINLFVAFFAYLVYFLALWNVPRMKSDFPLFLVMSSTILFNVIGVEWMYKGLEQYSYITFRSIFFKVLGLILMFLFVKNQQDYVIYGMISIVAGIGSNILNFLSLTKYIDIRPVWNYHIKRHVRAILVFFLMAVATTIYTNLDTVMLGFMKGDMEVGYYSAAVKVKSLLVSLVTALSAVLLPRVSYFIENNMQEEFIRISRKALEFVVILSVPVTVYFIIFSKETIFVLSGIEFAGSVVPMQIIMPTVFCIGITNVLGIQILVPLGEEKKVFCSVLAGAVVDLVVNAICIPQFASAGAAFGTLIAEFIVLIVQFIILKDKLGILFEKIYWCKIILGICIGVLGSIWLVYTEFKCYTILAVSCIIFFGAYAGCLILCREPLMLELFNVFKNMFERKFKNYVK